MIKCIHNVISSYILIYHRPEDSTQYQSVLNNQYIRNSTIVHSHSTLLIIKESISLLTYHFGIDQLCFVMKQMQDGLRDDMMQLMKALTD